MRRLVAGSASDAASGLERLEEEDSSDMVIIVIVILLWDRDEKILWYYEYSSKSVQAVCGSSSE
jgi:hypothetical protein